MCDRRRRKSFLTAIRNGGTGISLQAPFRALSHPSFVSLHLGRLDRDIHDVSVPNLRRKMPDKAMANLILLFALYLGAYLIGLNPAVPRTLRSCYYRAGDRQCRVSG